MLKGVLFDLGSTLQEYKHEDWGMLNRSMNRGLYAFLVERGYSDRLPPIDEFVEDLHSSTRANWDKTHSTMRGQPLFYVLGPLFEQYGITDLRPEDCLLPWYELAADHLYIEPDVRPALETLRKWGLKLGLVSNTAWPATAHDLDLARFGILEFLPCRIYSCEFGWEKPAPQIFQAALQCLNLPPEEVAFVGDFLRYDIVGAQAVGMKGIWKRVPTRPDDADDLTIVPDATITSIGELPAVLHRLYNDE